MTEQTGVGSDRYPGAPEKPSAILSQLEKDFETLDNVSFETLAGKLIEEVPTRELKVDPGEETFLNSSKGLLTNYKSDQLKLEMDHTAHIWIGKAVEVGILQVQLDHDSVLVIAPEAKIGIVEIEADHDSLVVAGPNVAAVSGLADHDFVLLHTPKTQGALREMEGHGVKTQTYGGNIYIPEARERVLAEQLLGLRDDAERLENTIAKRRRIIAELQKQ